MLDSTKRAGLMLAAAALLLAACATPDEARRKSLIGQENGESIYEFPVEHWPTAMMADRKMEAWIKREAVKRCPQGYREVSRRPGNRHVYYGSLIPMPYNDFHVRISCPAATSAA